MAEWRGFVTDDSRGIGLGDAGLGRRRSAVVDRAPGRGPVPVPVSVMGQIRGLGREGDARWG